MFDLNLGELNMGVVELWTQHLAEKSHIVLDYSNICMIRFLVEKNMEKCNEIAQKIDTSFSLKKLIHVFWLKCPI